MNIPVHPSLTSIRGHSSVLNSHDVVPKLFQNCPKVVSMFFGKAPKVPSEPKTVSLAIYPAMTVKVQLWYKRCLNYFIFIEVKNAFKMLSFLLLFTHVLHFENVWGWKYPSALSLVSSEYSGRRSGGWGGSLFVLLPQDFFVLLPQDFLHFLTEYDAQGIV